MPVPWQDLDFQCHTSCVIFSSSGTLKLERFGKSNNLNVFTSNETKEPKQVGQNRLRSPMTGVREHYFDNTKLFYLNTVYHFNIR